MEGDVHKTVPRFGPFKGLDEVAADEFHLEDCLNVECVDGEIRSSNGRLPFSQATTVRIGEAWAIRAAADFNSFTATDITAAMSDNLTSTTYAGALSLFTRDAIYVGMPYRFASLTWTLGAIPNAVVATLSYKYWNGRAWTTVGTVTDSTISAGKPFAVSGTSAWTVPPPWAPGNNAALGGTPTGGFGHQGLYWIQITSSANLTGTWTVAEIRSTLTDRGAIDLRSEINGLYEYATRNGGTRLMVGMDFPGNFPVDASQQGAAPEARLFSIDMSANEFVGVPLPEGATTTEPGAFYSFVCFNGQLIFTNGYSPICRHDGEQTAILEALPGKDAELTPTNPRGYLPAVPRGRFLAVYRNRLVVAGDPNSPNSVYLSEYDNNINNISSRATVGGPNVWPAENTLFCATEENDPVTGVVVINDRLVILKRRSVFVYDDIELRRIGQSVGCDAPRSLVSIGTAIFFLSEQGIFSFDGSALRQIGGPVSPTLSRDLSVQWAPNSVAANYRKKRQYRLWIPVNGEPRNRLCLIYDYGTGEWVGKKSWFPIFTTTDEAYEDATTEQAQFTSAAVSVSQGVGEEMFITGDYSGKLWLEDVGDENGLDSNAQPVRYAVLKTVGAGDEEVKLWRSWRIETRATGADLQCFTLRDDQAVEDAIGLSVNDYSTALADAPIQASPMARGVAPVQSRYGEVTTYPMGYQVGGIGLPYARWVTVFAPIAKGGRHIRPMIVSIGRYYVPGGGSYGVPAPFAIRGVTVEVVKDGGARS